MKPSRAELEAMVRYIDGRADDDDLRRILLVSEVALRDEKPVSDAIDELRRLEARIGELHEQIRRYGVRRFEGLLAPVVERQWQVEMIRALVQVLLLVQAQPRSDRWVGEFVGWDGNTRIYVRPGYHTVVSVQPDDSWCIYTRQEVETLESLSWVRKTIAQHRARVAPSGEAQRGTASLPDPRDGERS